MRFADSMIVITGAAGVYGRALAAAFAAEGARLLLTDTDATALERSAEGLPPGRVTLHPADLTRDADIDALVVAAGAAFIAAFLNSVFAYCLGCQIYLLLVRAGILGRKGAATA